VGITISQVAARERLEEAFDWASSDRPVPETWTQFVEQTFQMASKTYTPALALAFHGAAGVIGVPSIESAPELGR